MDLHNFPLDKQLCPLSIGSFGHTTDDIIYRDIQFCGLKKICFKSIVDGIKLDH